MVGTKTSGEPIFLDLKDSISSESLFSTVRRPLFAETSQILYKSLNLIIALKQFVEFPVSQILLDESVMFRLLACGALCPSRRAHESSRILRSRPRKGIEMLEDGLLSVMEIYFFDLPLEFWIDGGSVVVDFIPER